MVVNAAKFAGRFIGLSRRPAGYALQETDYNSVISGTGLSLNQPMRKLIDEAVTSLRAVNDSKLMTVTVAAGICRKANNPPPASPPPIQDDEEWLDASLRPDLHGFPQGVEQSTAEVGEGFKF